MRPLIHTSIAMLGAASMASAALVIHEDFNYTNGALNGQTASGTGLSGTWAKGGNTNSTFNVQSSSLTFAGHFASSGGALSMAGASPWSRSAFGTSVSASLASYTTLYSSSIMTMDTAGTYYMDWVLEQRFNTAQTGDYTTSSGRNILSSYEGNGASPTIPDSNRQSGVGANFDEIKEAGSGSIVPGTSYLFVTTYSITGPNMTATLNVFDQAGYADYLANPGGGLAAFDLFSLSDTGIASFDNFDFLQFEMLGGITGKMDNFRLGTELSDVVNVPEPSTALLGGLGLLGLLRRRR